SRRGRRARPSAGRRAGRSPRSVSSAVLDLQAEVGPALPNRPIERVLVRLGRILVERAAEPVAHVGERLGCGLDRVDEVAVRLLAVLPVRPLVQPVLLAAVLEQSRLVLHEEVELARDHVAERVAAQPHGRSRASKRWGRPSTFPGSIFATSRRCGRWANAASMHSLAFSSAYSRTPR